jgi:hypothetical protein
MLEFFVDNHFSFTCPIFNAEAKMSSCSKVRDIVYSGKRSDVRAGCQVCVKAGKCPADRIINKLAFGVRDYLAAEYTSPVPVKGRLRVEILERIQNVIVSESAMMQQGVSRAEQDLIATANERIAQQITTAPITEVRQVRVLSSVTPSKRKKTVNPATASATIATTSVHEAAVTGDLSSAISGS